MRLSDFTLWFILLMGALVFVEGGIGLVIVRRGQQRPSRYVLGIFARLGLFGGCLVLSFPLLLAMPHVFPPRLAAQITSAWLFTLGLLCALSWLGILIGIRSLLNHHLLTQLPLGFLRISAFSGLGIIALGIVLLHQGMMGMLPFLWPDVDGHAIEGSLLLAELGGWTLLFLLVIALAARLNAQRNQRAVFRYRKHASRAQYFETLSPPHLLQVAQAAHLPAGWHVFRPRRTPPAAVMAFTLLLLIPYGTAYLLGLAPLVWREASPTLLSTRIASVLSVLLAFLVGSIGMRWVKREADALLVLFPEGVMECEHVSEPTNWSCHLIAFACIDRLEVRKNLITDKEVFLELHYHTGEEALWPVGARFGSSQRLALQIIDAYRAYWDVRR